MTPRCVPAVPDFEHHTEHAVCELLCSQLPDTAAVLANMRFTDRRGDVEADLVIALPGADIAVLKVKGGAYTMTGGRGGRPAVARLRHADRPGQTSGAQQVRDAYLSRPRRAVAATAASVRPSRGAADQPVPDDVDPPDCPRWLVVDADQLGRLADIVRAVLQRQESENPFATEQDVDDLLTGRPSSQRDTVDLAASRELECDLLTERQAKILDAIRDIFRVEVRGGAGSGKTWLAVEQQMRSHGAYWESYWAGDDVFLGHVLGFKGLERPVVVLAVNGFGRGNERAREKLYVGLSRARDLRVVCGDTEVIRAIGGAGILSTVVEHNAMRYARSS